jgi:hypothetical protein
LTTWESFYVIVGSSAAALTGLQFVVIALVAEARRPSASSEIAAFGTPTVVHFCAVLLMSAILSAPWRALEGARILLLASGLAGLGYAALVIARARRTRYRPVFEDWLWHAVLPTVAYGGLFLAALTMGRHTEESLFVIGAVALLLLFIGIHNAWDTVTFVATGQMQGSREEPKQM